ncbi:MAG TPA: ketopantoate reductase family protein [Vicinamibacterales bacterium]|jgi:2-dehydropantoate 2-reductase|nr:ketopantoate reductase family protein [Vicinamibacterales bacterium]
MAPFDHIVVFGGGAIGSVYAAKLAASHDVTLIARSEHVDAINRDGLRLTGREEVTCHLRAATGVGAIAPATLVLLTTKVSDNRAAAATLAYHVRDDTVILCVQNGLGSEEVVKDVLGSRAVVLRAITQFGAIFREPGVIDYKVAGYTLIEQGPQSRAIASLLTASGLDGRVSDDIKAEIWRKLIFNCVINPITSLMGTDVGSVADSRLDPLKRLVIDECLAVARADGVTFTEDFLQTITDVFGSSRNIASMRQDLSRGKLTEIDFMNGAVVALGRRFGIDCPVNAALTAIIRAMEARTVAE